MFFRNCKKNFDLFKQHVENRQLSSAWVVRRSTKWAFSTVKKKQLVRVDLCETQLKMQFPNAPIVALLRLLNFYVFPSLLSLSELISLLSMPSQMSSPSCRLSTGSARGNSMQQLRSQSWWNEHMAWDVVKHISDGKLLPLSNTTHKKKAQHDCRNDYLGIRSHFSALSCCCLLDGLQILSRFCAFFCSSNSPLHFTSPLDTSIDYHTRRVHNHKQFGMLSR